MLKAYKFRLYPTKEQIVKLNRHFGHTRFVYNHFLEYSQAQYISGNKTNYYDWADLLVSLKKSDEYSWLNEVNSQALQQSLKDLQTSYVNFFRKKARFPQFKKKNWKNSFRIPQFVQIYEDEELVFFPKFKEGIKVRIHRRLPEGCKIRQATFSRTTTEKFFVSVLVETDEQPITKIVDPQKAIGIDVGLKDFAILSDGTKIAHPKVLSKYERKLARYQRRLSKKKKDSNNRNKARVKVALIHEKIANTRMDFIHKLTHELVSDSQADLFCVEDLNVSGMMKNRRLAKSISDSGWNTFKIFLKYKAEWIGKKAVEIDKFFPSSKICHVCGYKKEDLTLDVREWECPVCHTVHDRDINAAKNIRAQGILKYNTAGTAGIQACGDRAGPVNMKAAICETGSLSPK